MRTPARNWKYGQTDVNVLLLAVIWRGVAVPLLYELLPHGGGSHTEIRHTLMDDALCLLCAADIRVLYADREFVGYDWIQGLACRGIPICVRLRSDTLMDDWTAKDWLSRLQTGTAGLLVEDTLVYGQPMNVVLTHTQDGETLVIASNAGAVTTIQTRYRWRFLMEEGFLDEKSGLVELEASKLRDVKSLERLVMVISVAMLLLVSEGLDVVERGDRRRVDPHWQRGLSYLKIGHKAMSYALSRGQRFFRTLRLRGGPDPEPPKPRKRGQPSSLEALKNGWHVSFHFIS